MKRIAGIVILFWGLLINALAVPPVLNYAGQVAVNGEAFDGNGLFKFALVNMDGNVTYWSNDGTSVDGSEPQASVSVSVNGGLYAVLLGNTAQQGMGPIDPAVFAQHTDAKLRVWFSDEVNGFQQLSPDRPFASVPYAFSAGTARNSGSATIAPDSIDRSMLSGDIRSDLNRTISHNDLSPQIKADINATIGLDRLSAEVISKLEQNATITYGSVTTSKMADGSVTSSKIASKTIGKDQISNSILKYLKPNITEQPQVQSVYADINAFYSVTAEGKYLTYQWKKDGVDLIGEINATLIITDANATLHDGNYSVEVSNDFGSVESTEILVDVNTTWSTDGLVGWWKFDEGSGTVAYDSSENGNDGNLTNGPTWATGKIGGALSFDGVDDYVDFGQRNLGINSNLSVSYWFNPNDGNGVIVEQGWNFTGNEFGWVVHLGTNTHDKLADRSISFGSGDNTGNYNGSAIVQDAADTINLNTWQHVSVIKAGTNIKIYLVGSLSHEGQIKKSAIVYNSGFSLSIGKELTDTGSHYNSHYQGLIDDMRIYDRALSAEEVQALYNLGQ